VDFDGDGIPDLISGSYDPGEIYLFRGLGKGRFKARETIVDRSGKPILRCPDQKVKWESFGSWVTMVDWNNDGKPDLLIGGFGGEMFVRLNEGTRTEPAFSTKNLPVQVDGKDLKVPDHHATPVVADWDGDGLWDILTGSANGGVYWYRNIGKLGEPRFAPPVALVPPHQGSGYNEFLDLDQEPVPGIRSQIAVVDYNGDGKLDLLVGDFRTTVSPRKDLTPEQRRELQTLREKMDRTNAELEKLRVPIEAKLDEFVKQFSHDELVKEENQEKWRKKMKELYDAPEYKKVADEYAALNKALNQFLEKPAKQMFGADDMSTAHGYVWLYLRK
jgi:hypothetical protein